MTNARLIYHYEPEGWWVESPEYPEYTAFGGSREEVRCLAMEGLPYFADNPDLDVEGADARQGLSGVVSAVRIQMTVRGLSWLAAPVGISPTPTQHQPAVAAPVAS